ncbi:MAG: hypothetical protein HYU66_29145 [Armatimonadetes bacterium]|nr:hypothetical protein [Armatimonadota bacterium]
MSRRTSLPALVVCCGLALSGCQQPATPPEPTDATPTPSAATPAPEPAAKTVQLTGQVTAPEGMFGKPAEPRTSRWLDGLLISPAYAFAGVLSVGNVTVGVWDSDAYAVAVGAPTVVAQTDVNGYYVLPLPATYVPGPSLIVRVGDEGFYLRRIVTGVAYQDVTFATEVGVRVILAQTVTYPVDVRVIPATRIETVYVTVDRDFRDFDLRPILVKTKGPKPVIFEHTVVHVVNRVAAQPATVKVVRETVHSSFVEAKRKGHGVLVTGGAKVRSVGGGADKPHGGGADRPHGGGADKPHGGGADKPHGGGADKPHGDGADKPHGGGADKPHGGGADKPHGGGEKPHGGGSDKPHGGGDAGGGHGKGH